jgi:hypothetical protein
VDFDFNARFAGNQVALLHAASAEGFARDFDGRFVRGISICQGEPALLQDHRQFRLHRRINDRPAEMLAAAEELRFEKAALLRDQIKELKRMVDGGKS